MPDSSYTPQTVVKRLPVYLRVLDNLLRREIDVISSKELSSETGFTAEQIRKDLAYFGAFGTRGTGYQTNYLREKILKIIGLDQKTPIIIVGAGHLGMALTRYNVTNNPYVDVVAVFDNDPEVVGQNILHIEILDTSKMKKVIDDYGVKVAVIAVPADKAQEAVEGLVQCGIKAVLNFAPVKISVPRGVQVHNADLAIELQSLIYYSSSEEERMYRINKSKTEGEDSEAGEAGEEEMENR